MGGRTDSPSLLSYPFSLLGSPRYPVAIPGSWWVRWFSDVGTGTFLTGQTTVDLSVLLVGALASSLVYALATSPVTSRATATVHRKGIIIFTLVIHILGSPFSGIFTPRVTYFSPVGTFHS